MTNHVAATQFIYAYGLGQEDLLWTKHQNGEQRGF